MFIEVVLNSKQLTELIPELAVQLRDVMAIDASMLNVK
jgi:hypothetical protein